MVGLRSFFEQKRSSQKGRENEYVTFDSEKHNLNTSEENLTEVNTQKKNQKEKKLNPCGRRKIIPDNTVTGSKSLSFDDSLSGKKVQCVGKSAGETNEELLNSHREYVDLESSSLISRCSALMQTSSPKPISDKSLISDNTGKEYHISKPVVSKNGNSFSRTVQTSNQIPDGQSFSCCTTISNGISFEDACTTAISPERVYLDISDTENESSLNKSVNSYNHRKRKLMGAQDKNCAQINCFNYSNAESCYQFDCLSFRNITRHASQRIGSTLSHNTSEGKPKSHGLLVESNKNISPILHVASAEKKLHICCFVCKNPLGLLENNFLVACSSTSSSKAYLSYVLNYEPTDYSFSECLSRITASQSAFLILIIVLSVFN